MESETNKPETCIVNVNGKCLSDQPKLECLSSLEGWTREEVTRQADKTAGQVDVYYKSPDGKRIRSKPDLIRILADQCDISMISFKPTTSQNRKKSDKGLDGSIKCHEACNTVCFKLPESLYKLPGEILSQLTVSPLDTLKKIDITAGIKKSHHIKQLFQCLAKATALKEIEVNGSFGSESFSGATNYMALVLSRCTKIRLKHFKETSDFWKKCMASVKSNCREFSVIECNGLETVVSMLSGLLPILIHLEIINPDLEGFRQVREKKLFLSFFKEKVSQKSKLETLVLDKLWGFLLDVPPEIILLALNPLKSFSICRTSLYLPHLLPLVSSWAEFSPVSLSVESSWGCWNQLSSDHLVPAVTNISSVSFKGVKLCSEVLVSLLSTVASGCAVKELDLRGNDMSKISPDILVAVVLKLRVAVFTKCEMDEETVLEMLRSLADRDCYPEYHKDDYQGELEELHLTKTWNTGDQEGEEELVKLVKERAGVSCLKICAKDCKCGEYCTWIE